MGVEASVLELEDVELCQAQYWFLKPEALLPVAVAIMYCTCVFADAEVLPKYCAALIASAASCDWVGRDGAAAPLSTKVPPNTVAFDAGVPAPLQNVVPEATP